MSRKDPRKGIPIRLPEGQRRQLVRGCADWRPLPALMRKAVLAGLQAGAGRTLSTARPDIGNARPVTLQLAAQEWRHLDQFAASAGLDVEQAVLVLIQTGLATSYETSCDSAQTGFSGADDRTN